MVFTPKITNGGFSFTDGSLDMVGIPDENDSLEITQELGLRILQMIGEDLFAPLEGLGVMSIIMQNARSSDTSYLPGEILKNEIWKVIQQEPRVDPNPVRLIVTETENRRWNVDLAVRILKTNEIITLDLPLGGI